MNLRWQHYPRSRPPSELGRQIVQAFEQSHSAINSYHHDLESDEVLALLRDNLQSLGFQIEHGKKKLEKIPVPVLFKENGRIGKSFNADGHRTDGKYMIEVEAGQGVANNKFLKDLFQASVCENVDSLAIALRNTYRHKDDFSEVCKFMDTIFNSHRFVLPLKEVLIIGY